MVFFLKDERKADAATADSPVPKAKSRGGSGFGGDAYRRHRMMRTILK